MTEAPGRDAILSGTDIPVHVVAALTRGQTEAEIMEDYPGLTLEKIRAAVEYADAHPYPGPPLPTRSFKRMLSDMADAGIWDLRPDPDQAAPV